MPHAADAAFFASTSLSSAGFAPGWVTPDAEPARNLWLVRDHLAIAVFDGRIHVFGGRTTLHVPNDNVALHDVFDPATGIWTQSAPMPTARSSGAAAVYRGLIIYAGGECKDNDKRLAFNDNEAFNSGEL